MDEYTRLKSIRNITLIGGVVNVVLAVVKMTVGRLANSHALFADGVHSLSDLVTDVFVLLTAHYGTKVADAEHPYGHGRIETMGSIIVSLLLIVAGLIIAADSAYTVLQQHDLVIPGKIAIFVAILSIISKEWLYQATIKVAKKWRSNVLTANAWHHRSDAASSLIVVVGLLVSYMGYPAFDAVAAVIIGIKITQMGVKLVWQGVRELIDTGVDDQTLQHIQNCIEDVKGVEALHQLRSRLLGGAIFLDVHVIVGSKLSVSEGHHIGEKVQDELIKQFKDVEDVTVHVDPEDDETQAPSSHLPTREEILNLCKEHWSELEASDRIKNIVLHYLSGEIHMEVWFSIADFENKNRMATLSQEYQRALSNIPPIRSIKVLFY